MAKHLPIICGDTTCFSLEEQKMCRFVYTTHFGTRWVCGVYRDAAGDFKLLKDESGFLQRLPECIEEIK